ncbi:hypothetical protein AB1Y20_012096 [Prymnesium parvum]|uniref:Phospholipase B-like n=1 Tax=Prymnesium parvum TaxID=97485 RepID=A0AB34IQB6_PRYPA|mmetsp:Transcript_29592/g.74009  ORF Transcript_29592/g.74009 Transcript_29592/m.74009 type:complete len:185 (+) Transcript_29592:30-584(+)|eukprot:CAMPEP_0184377206 /NCGR_PEP_ID=MMETSP0007-20130409/2078_1 /TAXON_ID=97485 /ORGANISM="Prymnesium parvum, Strain Texoma1" /LENGTH=184 /DNA_ID=CAMNT_0026721021 /DNA_START=34 /DNA_END=588 /DNA_ORIENTATION=-
MAGLLLSLAAPLAFSLVPGVEHGWNTSVGTAAERTAAASHFNVRVDASPSLWLHNVMTPFIGQTLHMTGIDILERTAFNTAIEAFVKFGRVLWTIEPGSPGVCGPWVEHVNGVYTGTAQTAGFVNSTAWIENDHKSIFGKAIADDWGLVHVLSASDDGVRMWYSSYKKGIFVMRWTTAVFEHRK